MKQFLFLIATFTIIQSTKADTIDYWHVYLNGIKIAEYQQWQKDQVLSFRLDKIKDNDSIKIIFFSDTRCSDYKTYLSLSNMTKDRIKCTGKGYTLSFNLKELLTSKKKPNEILFPIHFIEMYENSFRERLLFSIKSK